MIHLTKRKWEHIGKPLVDINIWYDQNKDKDFSAFNFYRPLSDQQREQRKIHESNYQDSLIRYHDAKKHLEELQQKRATIQDPAELAKLDKQIEDFSISVNRLNNLIFYYKNKVEKNLPSSELPAFLKERRENGFTYTNYEPLLNILERNWFVRDERLITGAYAKYHNITLDKAKQQFYKAIDNCKKTKEWKKADNDGRFKLEEKVMEQFETPLLDRWETISRAYIRNNLWRMNNAEDQGNGATHIMMGLHQILLNELGAKNIAGYANKTKTDVSQKLLNAYAGGVEDAVDRYQGEFIKKHLNPQQVEIYDKMSEDVQETMMGIPSTEGKIKFLETFKEHILDKGEETMPRTITWWNQRKCRI